MIRPAVPKAGIVLALGARRRRDGHRQHPREAGDAVTALAHRRYYELSTVPVGIVGRSGAREGSGAWMDSVLGESSTALTASVGSSATVHFTRSRRTVLASALG